MPIQINPLTLAAFGFRTDTGLDDRRLPILEVLYDFSSTMTAVTSLLYGQSRVAMPDVSWRSDWHRAIEHNLRNAHQRRRNNGVVANLRDAVGHDGAHLEAYLRAHCRGQPQHVADALTGDVARFHTRRAQCDVRCGSSHICNGVEDRDRGELYGAALCLEPLRECFEACVTAVNAIYAQHVPWCHEAIDATVAAKSSPFPGLSATLLRDGTQPHNPRRRVFVELDLPVDDIGIETYDALWWTVLHELGVHGVQELSIGSPVSDAGYCPFTEGLVDAVLGEEFLLRHLAVVPADLHGAREVVRKFIETIRTHREDGGHGLRKPAQTVAGKDGTARQLAGYAVLGQLKALLTKFGHKPDQILPLLILSLNLELSARAPYQQRTERQRFIDCVGHWSDEGGKTVLSKMVGPSHAKDEWAQRYLAAADHFKALKSNPRRRASAPLAAPVLALIEPSRSLDARARAWAAQQEDTDGFDPPDGSTTA